VYIWLIKTNANGDTLWTRKIGEVGGLAEGGQIEQLDDGGYIITGCVARDFYDVYLVRTDSNGDTLWTRAFGGSDLDAGYSVQGPAMVGSLSRFRHTPSALESRTSILSDRCEMGNAAVAEPKSGLPHRATFRAFLCPNPFHSSTVLHLTTGPLGTTRATHFRIYDVQGHFVRALAVSP